MVPALRLVVVVVVLVLLVRAAAFAWRNRRLAPLVWRRIRPRHVLGSLGLLVVVLSTAAILLESVPVTRLGAGSFIGLSGNAVFAPLEEIVARGGNDLTAGPGEGALSGSRAAPERPSSAVMAAVVIFLALLLGLIPWLAYVEERAFREGLERAGPLRETLAALKFGLLHLLMLIPLAAALAIGVAGFAYGRVYRRAYRRAAARPAATAPGDGATTHTATLVANWRHAAVLEATTWHVTFNSLVVLLVLTGLASQWALAG